MILVDTTVLVYAVGADHPLRAPCRALVEAIRDGSVQASATPEVIQEFTHVRARRTGRSDAAALARSYAALLSPLLHAEGAHLEVALTLFEQHELLGAFDALLAAVAIAARAEALVSADAAFANVPGLPHFDPAGPDFAALVAAR